MKTRDICSYLLQKNDESFVRQSIFRKIIDFEAKNKVICMEIDRKINFSSANIQMEYELISIFDKTCDEFVCKEFMCNASKSKNATLIFWIVLKIDTIAFTKLTEDCYTWFLKQILESTNTQLNAQTKFTEDDWIHYLDTEKNEMNMSEAILLTMIVVWSLKTVKNMVHEILF
jgi:hypothetical protein